MAGLRWSSAWRAELHVVERGSLVPGTRLGSLQCGAFRGGEFGDVRGRVVWCWVRPPVVLVWRRGKGRGSGRVRCLDGGIVEGGEEGRGEVVSEVVKSLIIAGVAEEDAVQIASRCPRFIKKRLGRGRDVDEIERWGDLRLGAVDDEHVELSGVGLWSVLLEFVGVSAQATARVSRVLSNASVAAFLKKVEFLEELLKELQLDGEVFERQVHQMMRRLSVATDEDLQQTLSFFEKLDAQSGGLAVLASAKFATARLVEGFPQVFLRDLDTELRPVLTFLETVGVAKESSGRVLLLFPPVLLCDPGRDLQPRLRTLKKVGVRARDVGKMIVRYPWLLSRAAQNNVNEVYDFLASVKVPIRDVDRSITGCPQLLGCSSVRTLQPMVERMNELGVKSKRLGYVVAASPQLLVRSSGEFNEVVNFLLKIGIEKSDLGGMLKRHPGVFATDVESVLEPKVQFLRDLGMQEGVLFRVLRFYPEMLTMRIEESLRPRVKYFQDLRFHNEAICSMICRFPPLLSYNPEPVLKPKLEFLVNSMGRHVFEVVEYPRYFSYSLEKKIRPRARVIDRFKIKCSLKDMLALNDDQFAAKFLGVGSLLVPPG